MKREVSSKLESQGVRKVVGCLLPSCRLLLFVSEREKVLSVVGELGLLNTDRDGINWYATWARQVSTYTMYLRYLVVVV